MSDTSHLGHTFWGLFYFCLPIGLGVLWLWHKFLKLPLLAFSPDHLNRRITPADLDFKFGGWRRFGLILLSLWIGAALHVLWDGFTHTEGIFVRWWPALCKNVYHGHQLYSLLQYVSSVIGLAIIGLAYLRWVQRTPASESRLVRPLSVGARIVVAILAVVFALAIGAYEGKLARLHIPPHDLKVFVVKLAIATLSVGFVEVLLYASWWNFVHKKPLRSSAQGLSD